MGKGQGTGSEWRPICQRGLSLEVSDPCQDVKALHPQPRTSSVMPKSRKGPWFFHCSCELALLPSG